MADYKRTHELKPEVAAYIAGQYRLNASAPAARCGLLQRQLKSTSGLGIEFIAVSEELNRADSTPSTKLCPVQMKLTRF